MNRKITEAALNNVMYEISKKAASDNVAENRMAKGMKKCLELLELDQPAEHGIVIDPVIESLIRDSEKLRIIESLVLSGLCHKSMFFEETLMSICGFTIPDKVTDKSDELPHVKF